MKREYKPMDEEDFTEAAEDKVVPMQGFGEQEAARLAPVIERFMQSYANQPAEAENSAAWLGERLAAELPEKSAEEIQALGQEIQKNVAAWDEDMRSLNDACADGRTKEEWLEGKLQEASGGVNAEDFGNCIAETCEGIHQANRNAIQQVDGIQAGEEEAEQIETEQGAADSHALAIQLGKEIEVSNLASTVLNTGWQLAEKLPMGDKISELRQIGDALRSGEDKGVKEAAAAALKTGVEKGYLPFLPKDTPTSVTSGLACMGVEQAKTMLQFADGEISSGQAIDRIGRAATVYASNTLSSLGARIGSQIGQKVGLLVAPIMPALTPVAMAVGSFVGSVAGRIGGSVIGKAVQKAAKKIAEVAKPVLKRAWEGVKAVGRAIGNGIKRLFSIFD